MDKGKGIASSGKRKKGGGDDDKTGSGIKKRNRQVLQFFEDAADVDDDDTDLSDLDDLSDFDEEEFNVELKVKKEPGKAQNIPFIPKEEQMDEDEFDKMMEERYKDGAGFVRYADDPFEAKLVERDSLLALATDATIWKVKCMIGRERQSAFCLMQKFVDLKFLGTKLEIISAFSVDHVKGYIYIEAERQCDLIEACSGLSGIYTSRVTTVPANEISHLISVRCKKSQVTKGMWARVKSGNYKGDLAQIVGVNDERKRAVVKIIPRLDVHALAEKYGGGKAPKRTDVPAPRLINSNELEEFRPLIQYRRDRDTGMMFEVLDGLMLKDGFLYKKVPLDSLNCWSVMPTKEELLKFESSENNDSGNLEWLTQIYGGKKKKQVIRNDKGVEKGESSSGTGSQANFEIYDFVCFRRKDFGIVVGMEKDGNCKILKEGPDGPIVVTVEQKEAKIGPSEMKFTAFDRHKKVISHNDTVRVLEGPLQDREGIVRQIYRGIVFIYDQNETENGGYFCSRAQICEKVKLHSDKFDDKAGGESSFGVFGGFDDAPSSPKSPSSPKASFQARESNFNRADREGAFSIGQTLRIKVGPLKGYICRVLAVRRSDVTVKLDSKQKVLSVKCENLSEVRGRSYAVSGSEDAGADSLKPFDSIGADGGSGGWTSGAGTSGEADGWNIGGLSAERSTWPSFSAPKLPTESDLPGSSNSKEQGTEDAAWGKKPTGNQNSSWGAATPDDKPVTNIDQACGWGNSSDAWVKASTDGSGGGASNSWGKALEKKVSANQSCSWGGAACDEKIIDKAEQSSGWGNSGDGLKNNIAEIGPSSEAPDDWGKALTSSQGSMDAASTWDKGKSVDGNPTSSWGGGNSWGKVKEGTGNGGSFEKASTWDKGKSVDGNPTSSWGGVNSWGKAKEDTVNGGSFEKASTWDKGKSVDVNPTSSWGGANSWGKAKEDTGNGGSFEKNKSLDGGEGGWNHKVAEGDSQPSGLGNQSSWGNPQSSQGNSNWNQKTSKVSKEKESREHGEGWKSGGGSPSWDCRAVTSSDSQPSGWGSKNGVANPQSAQDSAGWNQKASYPEEKNDVPGQGDGSNSSASNQKSNWNSKCGDGSSSWGKKSDSNAGSAAAGNAEDSKWGKKPEWNSGSGSNDANQGSSWGKKSSSLAADAGGENAEDSKWGSGSKDANHQGGSSWGKKSSSLAADAGGENAEDSKWGSGSKDANHQGGSSWGKKSSSLAADAGGENAEDSKWGSGSKDANHQGGSSWGKSDWNSGSAGVGGSGEVSNWGKKANWNSNSNDANDQGRASWGKKPIDAACGSGGSPWDKNTDWNSGSGEAAGGNAGSSSWGKKANWGSGSNDDANQGGSSWGKKSNWNSGAGDAAAGGNADSSTWGNKKSDWNSGSNDDANNRDSSGWGGRKGGSWNSGAAGGDTNQEDGNNKSGSWSGGFGGRGDSDRGGFRGRGGDRGGFRGRGDRGGFGGRGDRGGFRGGRGGERGGGGFGGRGGGGRFGRGEFESGGGDSGGDSERGGFRGRGGRGGGYGGRGRGRWGDQGGGSSSSGWNDGNSSGGGWKSNNETGGGRNDGNSSGGGWKSNNETGGGWNNGNSSGGGWKSNNETGGGGGGVWNNSGGGEDKKEWKSSWSCGNKKETGGGGGGEDKKEWKSSWSSGNKNETAGGGGGWSGGGGGSGWGGQSGKAEAENGGGSGGWKSAEASSSSASSILGQYKGGGDSWKKGGDDGNGQSSGQPSSSGWGGNKEAAAAAEEKDDDAWGKKASSSGSSWGKQGWGQ